MRIYILIGVAFILSVVEGSTYSAKETGALEKFRQLVGDVLYDDYMKSDAYLIRWIRDQDFHLKNAEEKLRKALKWRKENGIDDLLSLKFGTMDRHFPYSVEGKDYEGRPILVIPFARWDLRKRMIAEGAEGRVQLAKYNDQLFERASTKIRESQNPKTGERVTQAIVLIDLNGYNNRQHGCAACLPYYYDLLTHFEQYYPQLVQRFIFINTPKIFQTVVNFLLGVISPHTRGIIKFYGHDKSEWNFDLKKRIPGSQLPPQFGGTGPKIVAK